MDEELFVFGAFLALFICFPVAVALSVTGCVAYSRTKQWDKERNIKAANVETNRLVDSNEVDESDFYDTDEENQFNERKAEKMAEDNMTFNQKFKKEFRKVWNGSGAKAMALAKEREERRKLAKAVAKEMDRRERRRAKKAGLESEDETLPAYRKE